MLMSVTQGVIVRGFPPTLTGIWNAVPENGMTAKAMMAGPSAIAGAIVKTHRSALSGITSSLMRSFRTSAMGWRKPWGPTRLGPRRTCMKAITLRSSRVRYATTSRTTFRMTAIFRTGISTQLISVSCMAPRSASCRSKVMTRRKNQRPALDSHPSASLPALDAHPSASLPIHAAEHDVDRPDERHDVGNQVPPGENGEGLEIDEAGGAEAAAERGLRTVALEVDPLLPAWPFGRVVDL